MKYFKKLIGERIYLSPISIEDAEKYVEWLSDFRTSDGTGKSANLLTVEAERKWIESTLNSNEMVFAIVSLEKDKLIGNCAIMKVDHKDRTCELGIFIGDEENRNKGYGAEALQLLLDFGFNYQNMHNIHLTVKSFNERAINCYKKIGFKEYGRRRESEFVNGKYYDRVYMDILDSEFEGSFIKNKNV